MSDGLLDRVVPTSVDPARLTMLLEQAGWHLVGGRSGVYNRLARPSSESETGWQGALVVPLDRDAPEYADLMAATLRELSLADPTGSWQRTIAARLTGEARDEFRFRKESGAPSGLISWKQGEELIAAARSALVAGAKFYREPYRHYSNRYGQFAGRYLDAVLMGQTAPGSYIVTAYAPARSNVALYASAQPQIGYEDVTTVSTREVTEAVVAAVEATSEALAHYRDTGSMSGFDERVNAGVSFEMTQAIKAIVSNSDGADVTMEWDSALPPPGRPSTLRYEFVASDAAVLERAGHQLAVEEPSRRATLVGRVHLLSKKEAGDPGVFGIETFDLQGSGRSRKVRVRLDDEGYHQAVRAHDEDRAVRVTGELERAGGVTWLYHATLDSVLGEVADDRVLWQLSESYQESPSRPQERLALTGDNPDQPEIPF